MKKFEDLTEKYYYYQAIGKREGKLKTFMDGVKLWDLVQQPG